MKKLFLLLTALLAGVSGTWATDYTYEVTLGSQVTDLATLSSSNYYVLKNCGSGRYNFYDGTQLDARGNFGKSCLVKLNYDGANVTIQDVKSGKYYQGLVENARVSLGDSPVNFTFNTDGVSDGQFRFANNSLYMNRNSSGNQYPMGAGTNLTGDFSRWNIYEATVTETAFSGTITYSPTTGEYTSTNGTWGSVWQAYGLDLKLSVGANNIAISTGYIYSGSSGCTYTLTAPEGYLITGYTISGTAQTEAQTLTPAAGGSATVFATSGTTTLTVSGITTSKTTFTQSTPNKGIALSSFTVSLMAIPSVTSTSGLNNSKCYNIINNRGWWAVSAGANDINSTVELGLATSLSDTKQQFAFIYYDDASDNNNDGYYLYSVSEGKFAYKNGSKLSLTPLANGGAAPSKVTFTASTNATYAATAPVIVTVDGKQFGVSTGISPDVYGYDDTADGGNAATIYETDDFDPTVALAAIQDYFHPTHTITFIVNDTKNNELFNSGAVNAPLGTYNRLPSEYHRDYFFTYSDESVTIDGESSANTNLVFIATPKSSAFQYTANTSSPIYYNLNIRSKYLAYNDAATGEVELLTSSTPFNPNAAWAFIGDPYTGFKIINQEKGIGYDLTYTSIVTDRNGGNNNIQFVADGDFNNRYWYVEANTSGFCLRMKENMNIYFHHDNGSNFLRTCSVSEWSSVHNDAGSTFTFASDEDVLADLYDILNSYTYGGEIGNFTPTSPWTLSSIESTLSDVKDDLDNSKTSDYVDDYASLLDIAEKITVVTPPDGYYRLKNAATAKYIRATNIGDRGGVVANLIDPASDISSVIQVSTIEGHNYLRSNTGWFNWVTSSNDHAGYLAANKDKYVNWLGTPYNNGLAFSIALGNGVGDYASYLNQGYYTSQGDEDGTIKGSNGTTAAAAWIFEPVTEVSIVMHSDEATPTPTYYATVYLPFDATISDATAYTLAVSGDYLVPTAVTDNKVPAGTPVLLKGSTNEATATINTGEAFNSGSPLECALTGTYMATTINGNADYVLGKGGSGIGFYHWSSNNLAANRAYLTAANAGVKGFAINWDESDGIESVKDAGFTIQDSPIFNLAGQRISKLQRGLNIVNGQKVIVK